MKSEDYKALAALLAKRSGLVLAEEKAYLVESRLTPVARHHGLANLDALLEAVRIGTDEKLLEAVTEAMTTNESFFFRDMNPFDQFRETVLPYLLEARARTKTIRIWSAACSNGQEPYSLAMILEEEAAKLAGWNVKIVATDISNEVLDKAKAGVYTQFEVQRGLPITYLVKYFSQDGELWQISPTLKSRIEYRFFNLLDDNRGLGNFDVIFCRNVLIYFSQETKGEVLGGMANIMPEDGFLFLGGAETVLGISKRFRAVPKQRGIYGIVAEDGVSRLAG